MVWEPHLKKDQILLESVQLFATRLSSQQWSANSETLNQHFNLPSLTDRCNYLKLLFTYKLVFGHLYCPPGFFNLRANPNLRVCHCKQLIPPFAKTTSFYNSFFFVSSARLWNSLPAHAVLCPSIKSFKNTVQYFSSFCPPCCCLLFLFFS